MLRLRSCCCWVCWADRDGEGRDQTGGPPNPPNGGSDGDNSMEYERCFPVIPPAFISSSRPTSNLMLRSEYKISLIYISIQNRLDSVKE